MVVIIETIVLTIIEIDMYQIEVDTTIEHTIEIESIKIIESIERIIDIIEESIKE